MKKIGGAVLALLLTAVIAVGCKARGPSKEELRMEGITKMEAGDYAGAVDSFEAALDESNGRVGKMELDILKYRGEAEYHLEDYGAAAHTYDILIQVDGKRPEYFYLRCISNARDGNLEKALEDYTGTQARKQENGPLADTALEILGEELEAAGETEKAVNLYQQALDGGLESAEIYNRMGRCRMQEKAYEEALEYFDKGLEAGGGEAKSSLLFNRAVAYEYLGQFDKALEELESWVSAYGSTEEAEREIAFLKTR